MKKIDIFHHTLFAIYKHYIMYGNTGYLRRLKSNRLNSIEEINSLNICICDAGDFGTDKMMVMMNHQRKYTKGFLFKKDDDFIGYLWIMMQGGNEIQYRIRNTDAFLYNICVFPAFRGNRYVRDMVGWISDYLYNQNVDSFLLACSIENERAYSVYKKMNMECTCTKSFVRFMGKNIPYHIL